MVPFNIYCGSCYFCARGLYSNCHNVNPNATAVGGIYGYSHTCGGYGGAQAEFVRVPFADVGPPVIPEWMEGEDALLCTDALATGYFGAQLGDIVEGDTVIVIVVDHLEYRLAKARSFANAETYDFGEYDDVVVETKKTTDFLGADVAIDAVGAEADGNLLQHVTAAKFTMQGGSPVALNWAIDSVRKGGTVSVIGAYGPMFTAVKFGDAMNRGLTIHTNQSARAHCRGLPRLFVEVGRRHQTGRLGPPELKSEGDIDMARTSERVPAYTPVHPPVPSSDELRARIPGWGAVLNKEDRPSVPKPKFLDTGAVNSILRQRVR
jgi:threonine dehydrogenase-like Zn-dependent dehydrogenase